MILRDSFKRFTSLLLTVLLFVSLIPGGLFYQLTESDVYAAGTTGTITDFNCPGLSATYDTDNSSDAFSGNGMTLSAIVYAKEEVGSTGGCDPKPTYSYTNRSASVTFTNTTVVLPAGNSFSVNITSGKSNNSSENQNTAPFPGKYTVTINSAVSTSYNVDVLFNPVALINGIVPGSYTAKVGNSLREIGQTYNADINTQYTLTATRNIGFVFLGWYNNGSCFSTNYSVTLAFSNPTNSIEARFDTDPLQSIAVLDGGNPGETCLDYVGIDSASYHSSKHSWHTDTYVGGPKDSTLTTYFEDPSWIVVNNTIQSSTSGKATGDEASGSERSWTTVNIYSDIIRLYAKSDIIISFKDVITGSNLTSKAFYTYVSSTALSGNPTGTILTETNKHESGDTVEISVGQGNYLYILSYGYEHGSTLMTTRTVSYSYTSTISNFTITPNSTRYSLDITYEDNIGNKLGSGKIKINDSTLSIGSDGSPSTTYNNVGGSEITLSVATVPTNYVFIGWNDVTNNTISYTSTYSFTLGENRTIKAIFAPVMIITSGGDNGYGSATYQYRNISGSVVSANGQYVARNADATRYYSSLSDAFSDTSVVVLLAGDTFNGDFTIPSGKTLVVPCGMRDLGPTTPAVTGATTGISHYAVVTVNGNWTINGSLIISATQGYNVHGRAVGPIGRINMSESSSMTVNGKLYAFGCVYGGAITTGNQAEIHEFLVIGDMANAVQMYYIDSQLKSKKVFPFSNYFIRNIESPVTYVSGAKLIADIATLPAIAEGYAQTTMPVIGNSGAMFL